MPSDDDFVHNYMIHVYKTSLQFKKCKNSQFQEIRHYVKVKLKPHHTHAVYMHAYVDTGADINLMPRDMYIKLYNDANLKHLQPSDIKLGVWDNDQIALLGKCNIYLVHPDTKKSIEVTFYVTDKSGSTLLSCATSLMLDLIKLCPRLGVPPLRAKIITSKADRASPAAKRITQGKVIFDEMSPLVQESAPYNCPIWAPFDPHVAPFTIQPHAAPFKPCAAPSKWQQVVIEKPAMHPNDQEDELSHVGSRSAPYDCPIWAPFDPHLAPFTIQPPCSPIQTPCKPCSNGNQ